MLQKLALLTTVLALCALTWLFSHCFEPRFCIHSKSVKKIDIRGPQPAVLIGNEFELPEALQSYRYQLLTLDEKLVQWEHLAEYLEFPITPLTLVIPDLQQLNSETEIEQWVLQAVVLNHVQPCSTGSLQCALELTLRNLIWPRASMISEFEGEEWQPSTEYDVISRAGSLSSFVRHLPLPEQLKTLQTLVWSMRERRDPIQSARVGTLAVDDLRRYWEQVTRTRLNTREEIQFEEQLRREHTEYVEYHETDQPWRHERTRLIVDDHIHVLDRVSGPRSIFSKWFKSIAHTTGDSGVRRVVLCQSEDPTVKDLAQMPVNGHILVAHECPDREQNYFKSYFSMGVLAFASVFPQTSFIEVHPKSLALASERGLSRQLVLNSKTLTHSKTSLRTLGIRDMTPVDSHGTYHVSAAIDGISFFRFLD